MINIRTKIHYEHKFRKIIMLILVIIIIISIIATTTLYIKENFELKKEPIKFEPKEEINIFDNLPPGPLSLPPE